MAMYRDPRQHSPVPWRWPDLLKALAAAVVVFFMAAILVQLGRAPLRTLEHDLMRQGLSPHVYLLLLNSLLAYVAAGVALALFIVRPYHASWATLGYRSVPVLRLAIPLLAYPVTVFVAADVEAAVVRFVLHGHFVNPQAQQLAGGVTRTAANTVGLLLLVAVLAPLVEETVFRGVLYQWLRKSLPVWAAAAISAAIFAVTHAIPTIFPWLFVTGLALALVFEYSGTLYCSMLLHGIINGVNVAMLIGTLHSR
jgi:membrane protease YdiL (CAAX protease family)